MRIAPVAMANALHQACEQAGAKAPPVITFDGAHEVTMDVVHAVGSLIAEVKKADEPVEVA